MVLVLLGGCATSHPRPSSRDAEGSAGGFFTHEVDAFQRVQVACGLEEATRHPTGVALYEGQARQLWAHLAKTRVTQSSFGPRLVLSWLLREALAGGERVEYVELLRRTERFLPLVVVRPDGYLVGALDGGPIQRLGQVKLVAGELKVGSLGVGAFYFSNGGVIYPVDEALGQADTLPWAELGLERDWLNAALDWAEDAVGEMALALAQSVLHPIRTVEGLAQLPTTVALLIASSPEYFARYGAMSLRDQIREAARLSTHLLMLYGGAVGTAGTVGRIGGLGAELPVLSVSADGVLAVRTVVVPVGTLTTTLGVGSGAVSIIHMAAAGNGAGLPSSGGPGQWVEDTSTMSEQARAYQAQVTGAPKGRAYEVCRNGECVKYDGYEPKEGVLLEAKALGYDQWFTADLKPKFNFQGLNGLREQARKQSRLAGGVRVRWYVAEPRMVAILQKLFRAEKITGIEVVYTPPLP